jgi:hypothetical protein
MALAGRSVDSGAGIDVLVDSGITGDMQVFKLGVSALGNQALIPGDTTNGLAVDVTRLVPGVTATALGKAEDSPATSGDVGVFVLAVRRDAPTSGAAAGDYHEIAVDASGKVWVTGTFAEDAAHTSGDYGQFVLGVQSLTRTSRSADGDYTPLAVDAAGAMFNAVVPEANSAWACSNYAALAATSGVIKNGPGKLYGVTVTNDNAAARYIQFFNLTAVPANGTAPLFTIKLGIGAVIQLDFSMMGKYFSAGICWATSTTGATLTLGAADAYVEARYL